jgi:hypothetical protein
MTWDELYSKCQKYCTNIIIGNEKAIILNLKYAKDKTKIIENYIPDNMDSLYLCSNLLDGAPILEELKQGYLYSYYLGDSNLEYYFNPLSPRIIAPALNKYIKVL